MDEKMIQNLKAGVEKYEQDLYPLIQRLVQIRSYSGEEGEIVTFILDKMREYGFDEVFSDKLGNAVGRIGNGPVKILFDAHIDTVKVTEDENWQHPPFEGKIVDGIIYGRGAVDEKPAMAGYLIAGRVLKEIAGDSALPFTLYVVGSVMEEDCDGYPLLHLINNEGIRPDYVLLGEPTDLRVYRGQRGRMELEISTHGKSAHGAHNRQGVNAIYKMARVVSGIEKLDDELMPAEPLGKGSITVSDISSRAPSLCSVPDYCRIHIDRRLTLGENQKTVIAQLKEVMRRHQVEGEVEIPVYQGKSWKGTEFRQEAYFPTWVLEENHPLVRAGLTAATDALGVPARSGVWSFSTNGVATAGRLGIPTIGFAPGKEELSHSSREALELADLLKAARFYALFPFRLVEMV